MNWNEFIILNKAKRQYLIYFTSIQTIALVFNLVPIKGQFEKDFYLFTDGENKGDFWPFSEFGSRWIGNKSVIENGEWVTRYVDESKFFGIFRGYDISEFLVYMLAILAYMYLPKLWKL